MMLTLLQTLLLRTELADCDPVIADFTKTVLPAIERELGTGSASGFFNANMFMWGKEPDAAQQRISVNSCFGQNQATRILSSLLISWGLLDFLGAEFALSDSEKRLLCVGVTFSSYIKRCHSKGATSPLELDIYLGEALNLHAFWSEWRAYLPEIGYLVRIRPRNTRKETASTKQTAYKIPESRLRLPLCHLISFGTIAVQLTNPAEIVTSPEGDRLQALLRELRISRTLVYHRLRNCTGLLSDTIHNALLLFVEELDWQPILFFTQGVIFLAPRNHRLPDRLALQQFSWEKISNQLTDSIVQGEVGFKRAGKGLKAAPQILELFSPAQLIRSLPKVVESYVRNAETPVTPKRLAKLDLSKTELELLRQGADLRADRLAEFIILVQREFFSKQPEFVTWMLGQLALQADFTPAQVQTQTAGVILGWYWASARYVAENPTLDFSEKLRDLAEKLATWVERNQLPPAYPNTTREAFYNYIMQYLELQGWEIPTLSFQTELEAYIKAKAQSVRQPICSLSSGEFPSEEQMETVVLFKPQQYSNKNPLGGRRIKRGISKVWSLEMLVRQARWHVSTGKLEERQPVFLYIFPTSAHAPQVTEAFRFLVNQLKQVNLWRVCRFWQENGMDADSLRNYPWLRDDFDLNEKDKLDLPFSAIIYTTTNGKTTTNAWVEPTCLALVLPLVLGIKVIATASPILLFNRVDESSVIVQIDGAAHFWNLLGLPTKISLQEERHGHIKHLIDSLNRLLTAYSIHLDCKAKPPDPRWQMFPSMVQAIKSDVLEIFNLAHSHFQSLSDDKVQQYWKFARIWAEGDPHMEQQLDLIQRLVKEYRTFYRVHVAKSTYAIVLPLSKVLEDILSTPIDVPIETLMLQTSGQLHDALRRQEPYKRPLIMDKSLSIEIRVNNEIQAIQQFVTTCIKDLFLVQYNGDRALLQEHRNRIRSGAEFAYRLLAMQEPKAKTKEEAEEEQGEQ